MTARAVGRALAARRPLPHPLRRALLRLWGVRLPAYVSPAHGRRVDAHVYRWTATVGIAALCVTPVAVVLVLAVT